MLFVKSYHYKFPYASKETSRVLKNRGQSARTASGAIRLPRLHQIDAIRFDGMIVYPMRWSRRLGNQWARPCRGVEEIFVTCFLLLAMNMPQKEFNSIWRPRNNRGWVNLTIPVGQPNHTYYSVLDIMRTLSMFVLGCAKIPPVGSRPFLVAGYFHQISMQQIQIIQYPHTALLID